jgi:thiol-disulfide isomerase/thioredoxin
MKSKFLLMSAALLAAVSVAQADVTVTVQNGPGMVLNVNQTPLLKDGTPVEPFAITLDAKGSATFKQAAEPVVISLTANTEPVGPRIFSAGGNEAIKVTVDADGNSTMTGTALVEGVSKVDALMAPYMESYKEMAAGYDSDPENVGSALEALVDKLNGELLNYIKANPTAPEAPYALMMLDGENFLEAYTLLNVPASVFMPSIQDKVADERRSVENEKRMAALENSSAPAPGFTLPGLDGKPVSLSDFKGKWVILDFWGSWCRWCVKGFPELKELSAKYGSDLVIVGIDCRDTQERWRAAVEKYGLDWVNVYNDCTEENNPLLDAYGVQGFPTKVIVNPEGKVAKIVVGAEPTFPAILARLMGK